MNDDVTNDIKELSLIVYVSYVDWMCHILIG
jgi:hypothetical protein